MQNEDGSFTCLHGEDESTSNVYQLCTLYKLTNNINAISTGENSHTAFPFIQCMGYQQGYPDAAEDCFKSNLGNSGLSWETVVECSIKEANVVQTMAKNTTPNHEYVPWLIVDGQVLQNESFLTRAICKAYTGPTLTSCKNFFVPVPGQYSNYN